MFLISHRAMASKAPQGMQANQEPPARRAFQGRGAPQDWACQAPKASAASPAMLDCPDHQASGGLLASPALRDRSVRGPRLASFTVVRHCLCFHTCRSSPAVCERGGAGAVTRGTALLHQSSASRAPPGLGVFQTQHGLSPQLDVQRRSTEARKRASSALPTPASPPARTRMHTCAHTDKPGSLHCCTIASPCRYVSPPDCDSGVKRPIGADGQETIQPGTVTTGPLETVNGVCAHGERPGVPPGARSCRQSRNTCGLARVGPGDDHVSPSCPHSTKPLFTGLVRLHGYKLSHLEYASVCL